MQLPFFRYFFNVKIKFQNVTLILKARPLQWMIQAQSPTVVLVGGGEGGANIS